MGFDGPPVFALVPTAAPSPSQPIDIHPSTVGFALGGVGLALEGGAFGLYLWNRNRMEQANAERTHLMQNPNAEGYFDDVIAFNQRADSIHAVSIATIGLAVAGGVALAGRNLSLAARPLERDLLPVAAAGHQRAGRRAWRRVCRRWRGAAHGERGRRMTRWASMSLLLVVAGSALAGCVEVAKLDPGPFVIDDFDDETSCRERKGSECGPATGALSTTADAGSAGDASTEGGAQATGRRRLVGDLRPTIRSVSTAAADWRQSSTCSRTRSGSKMTPAFSPMRPCP